MSALSLSDRRALALAVRFGRVVAVPRAGYWLSGGHRVAQTTVSRLRRAGLLTTEDLHDRAHALARLTERGRRRARPDDGPIEPGPEGSAGPPVWREARRVDADGLAAAEDAEAWTPPERTDELTGLPVPVDEALEGAEDHAV